MIEGKFWRVQDSFRQVSRIWDDFNAWKLFFLVMKIAEIKFNHWILNNNLLVFMVFNATFNNISVISWQSVLLVEETGVPGEKSLTNFIT
jgi:hypothetical protein